MKYRTLILSVLALCGLAVCTYARDMTASDKEEYERRGLSQIEWEMVLDSRMPMYKLDELQVAGITVSEYFRYPWLKYGITEKEWLKSRQSGLLDSDIASENKTGGTGGGGKTFSAVLLPGYHQFKQKVYWKGAIMTSVSVAALAIMAAGSIRNHTFSYGPLILLVPVMTWSGLDIGLQIDKERNPDAQRFSGNQIGNEPVRIAISIQKR
jgi:hypothetical protein